MTEQSDGMIRVPWGVGAEVIGHDFDAIGKLAAAMSATIADVGEIAKGGRNERDSYSYVTAGDTDAAIGAAMSKHGLAFAMSVEDAKQEARQLRSSTAVWSQVGWNWAILCADGGAVLTGRWISEAVDPGLGDKGLNKCATAGAKYLKLKLFLVATVDEADADADAEGDGHGQAAQAPGTTRPAQTVKATAGAPVVYGGGVWDTVRAIQDKAAELTASGYKSANLDGFRKAQLGNMIGALTGLGYGRDDAEVGAHAAISVLFNVGHFGDLTDAQCSALGRWLQTRNEQNKYVENPRSSRELDALVKAIGAGVFDSADAGDAPEPATTEESVPF